MTRIFLEKLTRSGKFRIAQALFVPVYQRRQARTLYSMKDGIEVCVVQSSSAGPVKPSIVRVPCSHREWKTKGWLEKGNPIRLNPVSRTAHVVFMLVEGTR